MDTKDRIAQWEKMTQEAPDEMAWFSLGNAYQEAGRLADAAGAFAQAIELSPGMSRAYQLHGQVLIDLDRKEEAAQVLSKGYVAAVDRGDMMPRDAIGSLLEGMGQPIPKVEIKETQAVEISGDTIIDRRTGQPGSRMAEPPMRGPVGAVIQDHYSQETWREWILQGTKVINELRLDFSNVEHQKAYERQMVEWLQISDQEIEQYTKQEA
jgi:Fe-S cluster biosynthesis and repair protein YggX